MEIEFYDPGVTFADPLISIRGVEAYRANVGMLSGANLMGRLLFTDCGRWMSHTVPKRRDGDADDLSVDLSVGIDDRCQVMLDQHHGLSPRR